MKVQVVGSLSGEVPLTEPNVCSMGPGGPGLGIVCYSARPGRLCVAFLIVAVDRRKPPRPARSRRQPPQLLFW